MMNGKEPRLQIIPLGGLEQIGMNITAFRYEDSIVVVDCGLSFPSDDMLGIDLVIPDITYLEENLDMVKGFVITHGHEDHIGALPYVLQKIAVPVYGTKLTMGIIEHKLQEHNLTKSAKRRVVKYGQVITLGCFKIEFIRTNHSIVDACALAITTPVGTIVHTGDFKVDYTPVFGDAIDLQRFAELGRKGVLALMSDSTNTTREGFTMSEVSAQRPDPLVEIAEDNMNSFIPVTFVRNCHQRDFYDGWRIYRVTPEIYDDATYTVRFSYIRFNYAEVYVNGKLCYSVTGFDYTNTYYIFYL